MTHTFKEIEIASVSWYDHLESILVKLPGPYWLVWIVISLLLFGLPLILLTYSTGLPISGIDPLVFVSIAQGTYFAILIRYIDNHALNSFQELRPILKFSSDELERVRFKLEYLPAWPTFSLSLLIFAGIVLQIRFFGLPFDLASTHSGLLIFTSFIYCFVWIMNGIILFHLYQRARIMNNILTERSDLSLFQQGGIHTYSLQGTRFAMLFMVMPFVWIFLDPGYPSLIIAIVFGMIALLSFMYPILGVHRVLDRQKKDLLAAISTRLEEEISLIVSAKDTTDPTSYKVDHIEKAHSIVSRYSTWPWSPGTFRQLIAAIMLPIVVWLLQYFLGRLISIP